MFESSECELLSHVDAMNSESSNSEVKTTADQEDVP